MILECTAAAMLIVSGWASQYAPGKMQSVVNVRQSRNVARRLPIELPGVDGYVAVRDCDMIGDVILVRPGGSGQWERFLIVDCAGDQTTLDWMDRNSILVELDWQTVEKWGGSHNRGIRIEIAQRGPVTDDVGGEYAWVERRREVVNLVPYNGARGRAEP